MARVIVCNRGGHDYSPAEKYGELVYLSEHSLNPTDIAKLQRIAEEYVYQFAEPDDFIMVTGLPVFVALLTASYVSKFHKINLLVYRAKDHSYIARRFSYSDAGQTFMEEFEDGEQQEQD